MPFLSKRQSKACYATNGFDGRIDCDEWAKETNYKSLPNRVKKKKKRKKKKKKEEGGYNMYRPKMQVGGLTQGLIAKPSYRGATNAADSISYKQYFDAALRNPELFENKYLAPAMRLNMNSAGNEQKKWQDIVNQMISAQQDTQVPADVLPTGVHTLLLPPDTKRPQKSYQVGGIMPTQEDYPDFETYQMALQAWLSQSNPMNQAVSSSPMTDLRTPSQAGAASSGAPQATKGNPYQKAQNIGIGIQAGRTALGFLSGLVERKRQNHFDMMQQTALGMMNPMQVDDFQPNPYNLYMSQGGNLKTIIKDYNKWSNDAGPMDMTNGTGNPELQIGGFPIARKMKNMVINNYGFQQPMLSGPFDALLALQGAPSAQGADFNRIVQDMQEGLYNQEMPQMKKGGFEIDKIVILRKLLPELLKLGRLGSSKYRSYKKGGIHIKKENKGKFTDYCGGKVTGECIEKGLNSPSATIRKRANFARNARKFKH